MNGEFCVKSASWAQGRYGEATTLLAGLRPLLGDVGGSRIQLEIFHGIEREAVRRHHALQDNKAPVLRALTWNDTARQAA